MLYRIKLEPEITETATSWILREANECAVKNTVCAQTNMLFTSFRSQLQGHSCKALPDTHSANRHSFSQSLPLSNTHIIITASFLPIYYIRVAEQHPTATMLLVLLHSQYNVCNLMSVIRFPQPTRGVPLGTETDLSSIRTCVYTTHTPMPLNHWESWAFPLPGAVMWTFFSVW